MIVDGRCDFYSESELRSDGFNDRMIAEMLGAPADERAKRLGVIVDEHVWDASKVDKAKDDAIDAKMMALSHVEGVPAVEWEPPEGFYSVKQARAMGFSKGLLKKLLPEPAMVSIEGSDYPMRVWRAEDVREAMKSNAFRKRLVKERKAMREGMWELVCLDYRREGDPNGSRSA